MHMTGASDRELQRARNYPRKEDSTFGNASGKSQFDAFGIAYMFMARPVVGSEANVKQLFLLFELSR